MKTYRVTAENGLNIRSGPGTDYESLGAVTQGGQVVSPDLTGWLPILLEDNSIGWVAAQYVQEWKGSQDSPDAPQEVPQPVIAAAGEPPWIVWARKQLGEREVPGEGDNPDIVAWFKLTTLPKEYWHDATAWCAVFVNAGFFLNGVKGLRSARAADWLQFGTQVEEPRLGDVVVFTWDDGSHHVAYFLALEGERVRVIGGNQSNAVTETTYPLANVEGFMRPPGQESQPEGKPADQSADFSTKGGVIAAIKAECDKQGLNLAEQQAYVLATVDWETGHTFKPVREAFWKDEEWRRQNLRYYPYYGRGYVQLTWKDNYSKYAAILGIDLVNNPDLALEPATAVFILVHGFRTGAFTGKKIVDYINEAHTDFLDARRCINGLDKAEEIAAIAAQFMEA